MWKFSVADAIDVDMQYSQSAIDLFCANEEVQT